MPRFIDAFNLATGETRTYQVTCPSEAIIYAHLADIGRKNTWEYPRLYSEYYPKIQWSKTTLLLGDWAALRNGLRTICASCGKELTSHEYDVCQDCIPPN